MLTLGHINTQIQWGMGGERERVGDSEDRRDKLQALV